MGWAAFQTPVARHERLLDEFERSGLSGPKYAALAGIKYQTLAGWARKRRGRRDGSRTSLVKPVEAGRWLEAVVEQVQNPAAALVLHLPGGVRVEVADGKQVALAAVLVRALGNPC